MAHLIIGARGSELSRIQAHTVAERLREAGLEVSFRWITTRGDRDRSATFSGVGIFVKEIQQALQQEAIDLAVHSAKDLPVQPIEGLERVAFLRRDIPWDVLIYREGFQRVGTSSPRRRMFLSRLYPGIQVHALRGNVDTRLRKLREGETDALILSAAGLLRLERWKPGQTHVDAFPVRVLEPPHMIPAPAQGVIAVEMRSNDPRKARVREALNHLDTERAVRLEQRLLSLAGAGCHAPFGSYVHPHPNGWEGFLAYRAPTGPIQFHILASSYEQLAQTMEEELRARLTK